MTIETNLWKELFTLAEDYFALKAWKYMEETDIFGIRCPESGNDYFISIMGSLEEAFALSAYEGSYALDRFWDIYNENGELHPSYIMTIPHMMVSLEDLSMVDQAQIEIMKQAGLNTGEKNMPAFRRIIPGFFPVLPDNEKAQDLIHILQQTIQVVKRADQNKDFIHSAGNDEDDYFFRIPEITEDGPQWKDADIRVDFPDRNTTVNFNETTLEEFISLPGGRDVMQVDLQLLPHLVKEGDQPAFFPSALIVVNERTGKILFSELLPPVPGYESMLAGLPEVFMKKCIEAGRKPSRLKYRTPDLTMTCNFLKQNANIYTWQSFQIKECDQAAESIIEFLDRQKK